MDRIATVPLFLGVEVVSGVGPVETDLIAPALGRLFAISLSAGKPFTVPGFMAIAGRCRRRRAEVA